MACELHYNCDRSVFTQVTNYEIRIISDRIWYNIVSVWDSCQIKRANSDLIILGAVNSHQLKSSTSTTLKSLSSLYLSLFSSSLKREREGILVSRFQQMRTPVQCYTDSDQYIIVEMFNGSISSRIFDWIKSVFIKFHFRWAIKIWCVFRIFC